MDERREIVYGLSGDEARECLAQMFEERVQHAALHRTEPPQQERGEVRRWLQELEPGIEVPDYVRISESSVQHVVTEALRRKAYSYSDQEARERVLNELDERDEHWRAEHPEEPEPGPKHLLGVVNDVRRASGLTGD